MLSVSTPFEIPTFSSSNTLEKRDASFNERNMFPGIENVDYMLEFSKKTLTKITLVYRIDLSSNVAASSKELEHSVSFFVLPQGELTCNPGDFLMAVRNQIYERVRELQHTRVRYQTVRIQVFELENEITAPGVILVKDIKRTPKFDFETLFVGRGKILLPERKLTKSELASLKMSLDFACILKTEPSDSARDRNRFCILGHYFLAPDDLFLNEPVSSGGNTFLLEGMPIPEVLRFCALLSGTFLVGNVPMQFYEVYRGNKKYYKISNATLTGLRFVSGTGIKADISGEDSSPPVKDANS